MLFARGALIPIDAKGDYLYFLFNGLFYAVGTTHAFYAQ